MAGRKSHLVALGTREPNQRIWEAIRLFAPGFTANDIARRSGQIPGHINMYFKALIKAGIIRLVDSPEGKVGRVFALVRDEGIEHPRLNRNGQRTHFHLAAENIWRSLRILGGEMSVDDICQAANVDNAALTPSKTRRYLNALAEAGYLEKISTEGKVAHKYRMVSGKNTGPRPPEIRQLDSLQVYDPNLSKLVYARTTGSIDGDRSLMEPGVALIRSRDLLAEWLAAANENKGKFLADLIERTRLELAEPGESGGLQ